MRVLMLSWEYPPHVVGGMGKHVMELAPVLAEQGVEVHVITPLLRGGELSELSLHGVRIHRVEVPHMEDYSFITFVKQTNMIIEQRAITLQTEVGDFALIHAHDWLVADASIELKHTWRRPLIATIHATERGRQQGHVTHEHASYINHKEWQLTYEAWRLIACSSFMADQLHAYFQTPLDKITVIPNGVHIHPDPFQSEEEQRTFRRSLVADDQPLVFYVGRIVYEKGVHILLEAWPQIRNAFPRARLMIAGTGGHLDALKTRTWELGIGTEVIFAGFIPDDRRDRLYHIADVATFPSIYEPFGIVALEAMAACCPVVVSATGGLSEVIQHQETGVTVYPNDPDSLAWGILETIQNSEQAHTRAQHALREVRETFNWQRIGAATANLYADVFTEWRKGSWGAELARRPQE